jgi:uncharacterized protein (DUF58 family)
MAPLPDYGSESRAPNAPDRSLRHRRLRDRAMILPLIGVFLLLPPVAQIFEIHASIAGLPLVLVYIFAVWAGLIVGTAVLARSLRNAEPGQPPEDAPPHSQRQDG